MRNLREVVIGSCYQYYQVFEYMFVFSKGKTNTINLIKDRKNKYKDNRHKKRLVNGKRVTTHHNGAKDIWEKN